MGEVAEDMLDGSCCSICGQYFQSDRTDDDGEPMIHSHGYPVVCKGCWDKECEGIHQLATQNTF